MKPSRAMPLFLVLLVSRLEAQDNIEGTYTTVSESECNDEIVLLPAGQGRIINTCRVPRGLRVDEVREEAITWIFANGVLSVQSGTGTASYEVDPALSCAPFGAAGSSAGLRGTKQSYWKRPIACR